MVSIAAPMNCFTTIPFLIFFIFTFFLLCFGTTASGYSGSGGSVTSGLFGAAIRLPSDRGDDDSGSPGMCAMVSKPASCPVSCFKTEPVCGADGVTYWCGCADAICAGTSVAKLGFCEDGSGGSGSSLHGQALLLVHIVWLILLGVSVLCGLF